jgi:methylglutaconyl-CoA hydratase
MQTEFIVVAETNGIATIALNRLDKCNAMHGPMVAELLGELKRLAKDEATHVLLIHGHGKHFCAGGDIDWMQKIAAGTTDNNYADAQSLADLLYHLYTFPKPTIVLAHGATLGGGLGLLSAADIAIAAKSANFGLPEVKMGITPSVISPYLLAAIPERAAHFYFLTGERFSADVAYRLGLIHQLTEEDALMSVGLTLAQTLSQNSPNAMREAKQLIRRVSHVSISEQLVQLTAQHLAELRATPEAQEGLKAFLEKRKPVWLG